MAIAIMGGLNLDSNNNREYPGAGGSIGGYTPTDKNISYMVGAGLTYETFTPGQPAQSIEPIDPQEMDGGGVIDPPIQPTNGDNGPVIGGTPVTPTTTGGSDTKGPVKFPPIVETAIERILSATGFQRQAQGGPMYLFTPQAPDAGNTGGTINMRSIITIAVVAFVGYFLYKKFA